MQTTTTTATETQKQKELNLVIIGLPGCGKGTQSEKIAAKYGLKHLSSGELLREEMEKGTEKGRRIKDIVEKGELLPDGMLNGLILDKIPPKNYILDGYPRKLSQAEVVKNVNLVLHLTLGTEEASGRILYRGDGREDDNAQTVGVRIVKYKEETKPVLDYYKERGLLKEIDGSGSPEHVFERIDKEISKLV